MFPDIEESQLSLRCLNVMTYVLSKPKARHVILSFEHPLLGLVIFIRTVTRFRYSRGCTSFLILAAQKDKTVGGREWRRGDALYTW